jgi:hypothetical protein
MYSLITESLKTIAYPNACTRYGLLGITSYPLTINSESAFNGLDSTRFYAQYPIVDSVKR